METILKFLTSLSPAMLIAIGTGLRLLIGMLRFNRRGMGGLQHFHNYFAGLLILSTEWVLKWAANITIVYGILMLLTR